MPNENKRPYHLCTPTKRRALLIYKDRLNMTWNEIQEQPEFVDASLSTRTLRRNYKQLKDHGDNCYWSGRAERPGGRPRRILSGLMSEAINRLESEELVDGSDVQRFVMPDVPARTIRRNLVEMGYQGFVQRRKVILYPEHVEKRRMWYHTNVRHLVDPAVFLRGAIIFSDESRFKLNGSDGRRYVHRKKGKGVFTRRAVQETDTHGRGKGKDKGAVTVWGCIHPWGPGELIRVHGNMDSTQYISILERGLLQTWNFLAASPYLTFLTFQQDNDKKHTSKLTTAWLVSKGIHRFPWPPKSPDCSPIENAWDELERRAQLAPDYMTISTSDEHFALLTRIWKSEEFEQYVKTVYKSFPNRLVELEENDFLWIHY